jgi:protein-tyrosine phosphatase
MWVEIIPGLYLGNRNSAHNQVFLDSRNINIILNVTLDVPFIKNDNIKKIRIDIKNNFRDDEEQKKENLEFSYRIDNILCFIKSNIEKGKNILVHDKKGRFRGTTIILSFLMKYLKCDLNNALKILRIKYPIRKNHIFQECLLKVEREFLNNS